MIAYSEYMSDARIRREAESLAQRGDHVECVCLPQDHGRGSRKLQGVQLLPLKMGRYRGESVFRYLLSYMIFFIRAGFLVAARHLRERYDVVQVHTMPDFMVFSALVPRLMGAGIILDVHDLMPELYMSKFGFGRHHWVIRAITRIERASIRFAHKAIAVHKPHLEALTGHGSPPERFEVLLNTPDPTVFTRRDRHQNSGGFNLVYHGTISRRHGLELAIRAVDLARKAIENLKLTIIGSGDDLERLIRLSEELSLDGHVHFAREYVPVNMLPELLAHADLGVVPLKKDSFTQYMLPVKMMEYAALGVPVIVTRTTTIERYFDDSMVQFISGESVEELATRIEELYRDPRKMASMTDNARTFSARYNWDEQKLVYYGLIDSLAGSRR